MLLDSKRSLKIGYINSPKFSINVFQLDCKYTVIISKHYYKYYICMFFIL